MECEAWNFSSFNGELAQAKPHSFWPSHTALLACFLQGRGLASRLCTVDEQGPTWRGTALPCLPL